ncbi:MAG TPA: peptidoglycan editing factor PgeF [Candidatus Omnitrophota bacterium]|nr:peptidoglycan editing factor PgeF [Candidatus Omnitrophota bacterium]
MSLTLLDHPHLIAFTGDASVDFTTRDFDAPLTTAQSAYLKTHTGIDIPRVFWRKQVHGDDVLIAGKEACARGCPDADAFITDRKNVPIAIRTADCVPVFIYDPLKQVIALVHAGWKGTRQRIAAKTVQEMQDKFTCRCYDLKVALGPAIRSCCYEAGPEFKAYFPDDTVESGGKIYVDIVAANRRQLVKAGVPDSNIFDGGICTCCNKDYSSFRRDGEKAGRMISLMMLL